MHKLLSPPLKRACIIHFSEAQLPLLKGFLTKQHLEDGCKDFFATRKHRVEKHQQKAFALAPKHLNAFYDFCRDLGNWLDRPNPRILSDSKGNTTIEGSPKQTKLTKTQKKWIEKVFKNCFRDGKKVFTVKEGAALGLPYKNGSTNLYQETGRFHVDSPFFEHEEATLMLTFGRGVEYVLFPIVDMHKFIAENMSEYMPEGDIVNVVQILTWALNHAIGSYLETVTFGPGEIKQTESGKVYHLVDFTLHRRPAPHSKSEDRFHVIRSFIIAPQIPLFET